MQRARNTCAELSARELVFIAAFCDPSCEETFHNAAGAARAAGYSVKSAKKLGSRLLSRPRVGQAIAELQNEVRERVVLDQVELLERALKQADAWQDELGQPLKETYATQQGELYERRARPDSANVRALELAGRAVGLIGKGHEPSIQTNHFIVEVPPKAESADEWMSLHREGHYGGRDTRSSDYPDRDI